MPQVQPRSKARPLTAIYPTPAGNLLVPTEDMWLIHEASKPTVVERRAKITPGSLLEWKRRFGERYPWLPGWLYGEDIPDSAEGAFEPTGPMLAFRKEASISVVRRAAVRSPEQGPLGPGHYRREHVSHRLISAWRDRYRGESWFDGWLLIPNQVESLPFEGDGPSEPND